MDTNQDFSHAKYPYLLLTFLLFSLLSPPYVLPAAEILNTDLPEATLILAEQGDAEAQFSLYMMYDEGRLMPQDKQNALHWLTKSAQQNLPVSCLYLGMKYEFGNGVPQDNKTAKQYYKKAAEQGWPMAQYFLARLLLKGKESIENKRLAAKWLQLASRKGYPGAKDLLYSINQQIEAEFRQ
jgi:TPR repeat protein